jgi:hypothetical protein
VATQRNVYVLYRDGAVVSESERVALDPAALRTSPLR